MPDDWKVKMNSAALEAAEDLKAIPTDHVATLAVWWEKWFPTAGHKRLGKLVLAARTNGKAAVTDDGRLVFKA